MPRIVRAVLALLLALTTIPALAQTPPPPQTIRVTVRGADDAEHQVGPLHNSGDAITITTSELETVSGLPFGGYQFMRIYDTTTSGGNAPVADIGPVTIVHTSDYPPAQIRLLVAPPPSSPGAQDGDADFPLVPLNAIRFAGARSFRSLSAPDCGPIRCAIAVTRDIGSPTADPPDQILVAQAYRLQAEGERDATGVVAVGGNIYAKVNADMSADRFPATDPFFGGQYAVGFVWAAQSIQADILATGAASTVTDTMQRNGIDKIRAGIGPNRSAVFGITRDILAVRGRIGTVLCDGPIGTVARRSQIQAANGIDEVRVVSINPQSGNSGSPAEFDIRADIASDLAYVPSTGGALADATLKLVQTDGGLIGSVRAGNIPAYAGFQPSGILVRGSVDAPITVKYNLQNASIIGASFTQPIWIGILSKGCVVATDPANGEIPRVEIGYETVIPQVGGYTENPLGMAGTDCEPMSPALGAPVTSPDDVFDVDDWLLPAGGCFDGGFSNSLVRAKHIGIARVHEMTTRAGGASRKMWPPRIEAQQIDSLEIGDMREGVVWSGKLEATSSGSIADDPSNNYAHIGSLQVLGSVGPSSAIWFDQCPSARIYVDVLGELHLSSLASSETLRIDGGLLNNLNECECAFGFCNYPAPTGACTETSPRCPPCVHRSAIRVRETQGPHGQIILNGAWAHHEEPSDPGDPNSDPILVPTDPLTFWKGDVVVGAIDPTSAVTLKPENSQPTQAPYYDVLPTTLGGGSVGLAPFHLHEKACVPQHADLASGHGVLETDFGVPGFGTATPALVFMQFYGPITKSPAAAPWSNRILTEARPIDAADPCEWSLTLNGMFKGWGPGDTVTLIDATTRVLGSNTLGLSRKTTNYPHSGVYRIVPILVLCKSVTNTPLVESPPWCVGTASERSGYVFKIAPDCNIDGRSDETFPPDPSECPVTCRVDVNHTGTIEVADIFTFLNAWFSGCCGGCEPAMCDNCGCAQNCCSGGFFVNADFDLNHHMATADVFAFLNAWFASGGLNCQ